MPKGLTQIVLHNIKPGAVRREIADGGELGLFHIVQPSGARSWAFRYRFSGRTAKLTLGAYPAVGLSKARDLARRAKVFISDGLDPAAEKRDAKAAEKERAVFEAPPLDLVEDVVDTFIERYAKPKLRSATEIERILRRDIVAHWRGRRLSSIGKADVHARLDEIVGRGAPVGANRIFAALRKLCAFAVERGLIDASPCAGIKPPSPEKSRDRILSDDEIKALWAACETIGWPFGPLTRLLLLTGQRREEVAKMRWVELDLEAKTWTLPRERAKNGREHVVPLSGAAIEILQELPRIAGRMGFVFSTNGRTPVSGFSKAKRHLDAEMRKAAPDFAPWVVHDLRRTFASGCARLGVAIHVVEACLNHRSGTIRGVAAVYNRYSYAPEKNAALEAWARVVSDLVTNVRAR